MSSKTKRHTLSMIMAGICFIATPILCLTIHSILDDMINIIEFQTEMSYMRNGIFLGTAEAIAQMEIVQLVSIASHSIFWLVFAITFVFNFKCFKEGYHNDFQLVVEEFIVGDVQNTP